MPPPNKNTDEFGGVVAAPSTDEFGGVRAEIPPSQDGADNSEKHSFGGFGSNLLSSGVNLASGISHAVMNPIETASNFGNIASGLLVEKPFRKIVSVMHGHDIPETEHEKQVDTLGNFYKNRYGGIKNIGETLYHDPMGAAADVSTLAGGLGEGAELANLPRIAAPLKTAAAVTNPLTLPARGAAMAAEKIAEPLVGSALRLRGAHREYGSTPERAVLANTSSVHPDALRDQAQNVILRTNQEQEAAANASPNRVPLGPTRQVVSGKIDAAKAGNSIPTQLEPIMEHLTVPHEGFAGSVTQPPTPMVQQPSSILAPNGQPVMTSVPGVKPPAVISDTQSPMDAIRMKRRLANDFTNFKPGEPREGAAVANQAHHQLKTDIDTAVPGSAKREQLMQSLIPVVDRSNAVSLGESPIENIVDRATRPTGGLIPALAAGSVGGPGAAGLTLGAQALLASPTAKLIGARTLFGTPLVPGVAGAARGFGRLGRVAPLLRIGEERQ